MCLDEIEEPKKLNKCGHTFCTACIDEYFKRAGKRCPVCEEPYGVIVGNQPPGSMTWHEQRYNSVPGYERYGVIVINYSFYGGTQGQEHPNPGRRYTGTQRRAYLPGWRLLTFFLCKHSVFPDSAFSLLVVNKTTRDETFVKNDSWNSCLSSYNYNVLMIS